MVRKLSVKLSVKAGLILIGALLGGVGGNDLKTADKPVQTATAQVEQVEHVATSAVTKGDATDDDVVIYVVPTDTL